MRNVVLLRYGLSDLYSALRVGREEDGRIWCRECHAPFGGMSWEPDGRFALTGASGSAQNSQRRPLHTIDQPLVAYTVPGPRLLEDLPPYAWEMDDGAAVQVSGHAVREEPYRVELQIVLVPRGEPPYHRETVGDRRIDDGQPDIWVVLDRWGDDLPTRVAAAQRVPRWPPPVRAQAKPRGAYSTLNAESILNWPLALKRRENGYV